MLSKQEFRTGIDKSRGNGSVRQDFSMPCFPSNQARYPYWKESELLQRADNR
jgi:hypothetical protein